MKFLISLPLVFIWFMLAFAAPAFVNDCELFIHNPKAKPKLNRKKLAIYMTFMVALGVGFTLLVEYCEETLFLIEFYAILVWSFIAVMTGAIGGKRKG